MEALQSYMGGEWVRGMGTGAVLVNPATAAPVAETSTEGLDTAAALAYARSVGGPELRRLTFQERGALLKAMSKALHEAREELIAASVLNAGTTRSDAKFDVDGATGTLAYYAKVGKDLGDRRYLVEEPSEQLTASARFAGLHVRMPLTGAAVHINAFNFPAWGLAEKAALAILAGMPVISKPATATALTAFRAMQALVSRDVLPPGALQLVAGSTQDLLTHLTSQDVLAFTGSGSTAQLLRRLEGVVERSVRLNVEADSLNSAILGPDAEPGAETYQMFLRDCVKEITQKTGQKCTAIRRIFVPRALVDRVQEDLAEELSRVVVGDPALAEVRMGPLATAAQRDSVRAGIDRLVASGARPVFGQGSDVSRQGGTAAGFFFGPTLLRADRPASAAAVHEHEVFGPVATLMPYDEVREAAHWTCLGDGGLVTSCYSDDRGTLRDWVEELAPFHGRVLIGSRKVADQAISPGLVLPSCVHGGPGRAGGGEELGGVRGLALYLQRTALQGDRALLEKITQG